MNKAPFITLNGPKDEACMTADWWFFLSGYAVSWFSDIHTVSFCIFSIFRLHTSYSFGSRLHLNFLLQDPITYCAFMHFKLF